MLTIYFLKVLLFFSFCSYIIFLMKFSKKLLFVFFILIFSNLVCFALPENPLALNFSLGTSAVVYGDENIKLEKDNYFLEDYSRFILNSEASFHSHSSKKFILSDFIPIIYFITTTANKSRAFLIFYPNFQNQKEIFGNFKQIYAVSLHGAKKKGRNPIYNLQKKRYNIYVTSKNVSRRLF